MSKAKKKTNMITIIGCLVVMFSVGIVYLGSVFNKPMCDYYGWAPESVRMIFANMIFAFIFGVMIGGFLQDKRSPRFVILLGGALFFAGLFSTSLLRKDAPLWQAFATYSAVAGCGVGFAYAGSINCIQKWFPHRRGFASGISVCAFGLSAVVFAPLAEWLLKLPAFGDVAVPSTFRTLALVFTVLIIVAGIFVKNPDEGYLKSLKLPAKLTNQRQYRLSEAVRTLPFWCLSMTILFLPVIFMIVNPIIKSLGGFRGLSDSQASLMVMLTGPVQAVSRLICGTVSDKIGRAKTLLGITAISIIAALLLLFARDWAYIIAVMLVFFAYAGPSSIYPAMATDVYGTKHSGANYGVALMFLGISSPLFTFVSGLLDPNAATTGDYTKSFILAACVCIIPLVALPLYDLFKKRLQDGDKA